MDTDPTPEGPARPVKETSSLHVLWHWVIMATIMTALIGGAALVF
ncbi:MAG: hypothetical protein ACK41U_18035 [Paracoccus sp. (in: a-proteobacteria)]